MWSNLIGQLEGHLFIYKPWFIALSTWFMWSNLIGQVILFYFILTGGPHLKPPKSEHIFVAVITFFSLSFVQILIINLLLIVCALRGVLCIFLRNLHIFFVPVITFPPFFCANNYYTSLLLIVCALRWYVKCFYRHLFLEDKCKKARITPKMALPNLWQV